MRSIEIRELSRSAVNILYKLIRRIIGNLINIIYILFPPIELHWKNWRADFSFRITENPDRLEEFKDDLQNNLSNTSGKTEDVLAAADQAHRLELDRTSELNSKAATYLTNIGIVLSILSLAPILAVAFQINLDMLYSLNTVQLAGLMFFSYAVLMFLLSAIYSYRAMKIRGFHAYYSADGLASRLKDDEFGAKQQAIDLVICRKQNEEHTADKVNILFAAEALHRNGLVALSLGIISLLVATLL